MRIIDKLLNKIAEKLVGYLQPHILKTCEDSKYSVAVFGDTLYLAKGSTIHLRNIPRILEMK